ncbi:MAG TPA: DUF5318 family protein [Acidimicrobiales bacterium]|nr:DUF5318 family protein [Acidimicrobiales bacterium]
MSFRPENIGGAGSPAVAGQIDYRLVRRHTVDEFRRGRLGRRDICDAHPELLRAARNIGRPSQLECPICEDAALVLVSFAFGLRLPPSGKVVDTHKEMTKLARRREECTCYVVEVCPECAWNHLVRAFPLGGRRAGTG